MKSLRDPSITCPKCKRVSYHPEDIEQKFCIICGFHEGKDPMLGTKLPRTPIAWD